jgi:hypothetical protein
VSNLAAGLQRLMADPGLRMRLAAAAPESVRRFALRDVLDDWILRLGSEPGHTGNADEIRERLQRARAALEPEDAP